jgi:D-glycerate 3-kinase
MTTAQTLESALADYAARDAGLEQRLSPMRLHYLVLAEWIASQAPPGRTLIVGINGAQGSGKSSLAALLQHLLEQGLARRTVAVSIDDFYATHADREALARTVHPLLATRGVPGTHDVGMATRTLERLRTLAHDNTVCLPRFIKAYDDRAPEHEWPTVHGTIDIVLFEGWCVGTPPQAAEDLVAPANALELEMDTDRRWRRHVNEQLQTAYADLFSLLDRLVLLQAPCFEVVHGWRVEQETGNAAQAPEGSGNLMTSAELHRFIAHYERLTRHALRVVPTRADVVLALDEQRQITEARYR